ERTMAIQSNESGMMTFTDICQWIMDEFPYYGTVSRRRLNYFNCFVRVRSGASDQSFWIYDPQARGCRLWSGDRSESAEEGRSTDSETFRGACKICLTDDLPRSVIIPCGHVACSDCYNRALRLSEKCPFCRGDVEMTLKLYNPKQTD
ncbi:hypothetical protein PENTCL1PPCAC_1458, partial [Pristionchus entomophagus]